MKTEMTKAELARWAREMSNAFFKGPCEKAKMGIDACMTQEEERPLTRTEKREGFQRRPFWAYDPNRMCMGCRTYWYAEMAAQAAERDAALEVKYG